MASCQTTPAVLCGGYARHNEFRKRGLVFYKKLANSAKLILTKKLCVLVEMMALLWEHSDSTLHNRAHERVYSDKLGLTSHSSYE